jgi:16S rRNA (cytosine1402-N4)-methyltransferase
MRMDDRMPRSAADLVNSLREGQLSDLIWNYSQERFSRRIAQRICSVRREARITRTHQLVDVICRSMGVDAQSRPGKIHPATRTFQALRIAVNDELGALEQFLDQASAALRPGGRLGVIAFHSLEDGVVKRDFRRRKENGEYELVNKRPVVAGEAERRSNPRSRSAKLRVARRTGGTQ